MDLVRAERQTAASETRFAGLAISTRTSLPSQWKSRASAMDIATSIETSLTRLI